MKRSLIHPSAFCNSRVKLRTLRIRSKHFVLCHVLCAHSPQLFSQIQNKDMQNSKSNLVHINENTLFIDRSKHGHLSIAVSMSPRAYYTHFRYVYSTDHFTGCLVFPFSVRQPSQLGSPDSSNHHHLDGILLQTLSMSLSSWNGVCFYLVWFFSLVHVKPAYNLSSYKMIW